MRKNGWILLLVLILVAFLVSCGKKNTAQADKGELVKREAEFSSVSFLSRFRGKIHSVREPDFWYNPYEQQGGLFFLLEMKSHIIKCPFSGRRF